MVKYFVLSNHHHTVMEEVEWMELRMKEDENLERVIEQAER